MKLLLKILLLFIGLNFNATAQSGLTDEENDGLDRLIKENLVMEYDAIKSKALSRVFDAEFYDIKVYSKYQHSSGYTDMLYCKTDEGYIEINYAEQLFPMLRPDFRINNEEDAIKLEKAIDAILPVFFSSSKEHFQIDDKWIFVRSVSFGEKTGLIVSTDKDGRLINFEYKDELEKINTEVEAEENKEGIDDDDE